jgi:biotin carboxyl carrier protein
MYKVMVNGKELRVEAGSSQNTINKKIVEADIIEYKKDKFHILRNNRSDTAEIIDANLEEKSFIIKVNNKEYFLTVKDSYDELLREMGFDSIQLKKSGDIKAPMPGLVLNVMVSPGQQVKTGDAIIVLEAMKMENVLKAHADGEVKKIIVKKGDKVEKNQVMISLG